MLWRHLTPKRKTETLLHNYNPFCIQLLKKDFGIFTCCRTIGARKPVHSEPFLDYLYKIWHLLSAPGSEVRQNFYTVHICIFRLNYCGEILWSTSAVNTKWCAQTFPPILRLLEIFDRKLVNIVAPPSDKYDNYVVHMKAQWPAKKRCKPHRNRAINSNAMLVRTMYPSNAR